jgi:hypothetical protein
MKPLQEKLQKQIEALQDAQKAIKKRIFTHIAAGFGLVVGLAWNDAIKFTIENLVPDIGNTIIAKLVYAISITVIVGLVLFYIDRMSEKDTKVKT